MYVTIIVMNRMKTQRASPTHIRNSTKVISTSSKLGGKMKKLNQSKLASQLGISKSYLSMILSGQRIPNPELADRICSQSSLNYKAKLCSPGSSSFHSLSKFSKGSSFFTGPTTAKLSPLSTRISWATCFSSSPVIASIIEIT